MQLHRFLPIRSVNEMNNPCSTACYCQGGVHEQDSLGWTDKGSNWLRVISVSMRAMTDDPLGVDSVVVDHR